MKKHNFSAGPSVLPKEVIEESKKKMRAINSAWSQIQKLKTN